jgi:predicted Zn-dependent protease
LLLEGAPSTPAFQSLRRLAAGELPAIEQTPEWFAAASALEMFVDGTRLTKQAKRMPYSQRPAVAKLALAHFEEAALRSKTTRMLYQTERALAADNAHDERAVRSTATALIVLWPDQARGLFTAGEVLWPYDVHAAIVLLERSVALDPDWGPAHQVLGNALHEAHDLAGSERELWRAIAIDPKDADAFNTLGYVYTEENCGEEARAAFRSALFLRPQFEFWAGLGVIDSNTGHPEDAERELRAALELDAHQSILRVNHAQALDMLGRREEALAELETERLALALDLAGGDGGCAVRAGGSASGPLLRAR